MQAKKKKVWTEGGGWWERMKWRWWGTWGLYCHPRSKVKLTLARSTQGHFWGVGGSSHSYTNTHKYKADLLNSPGKGTASERASVTHASKNKLGSCENKAWEPWNLGVVKGVGSAFVRRDEGMFMGFYWWARERGVTRTEAKGRRPRPLS